MSSDFETVDSVKLVYADYTKLVDYFKTDSDFSSHPLLEIAVKIFKFLHLVSSVKAKYEMFINDRNTGIHKMHPINGYKTIKVEDLVAWRFMKKIVTKMEFINQEGELDEIYFAKLP